MTQPTILLNAIIALTHRPLYLSGYDAISQLKSPDINLNVNTHAHVHSWNSVFSGISVITNRITPKHLDTGGDSTGYDLLLSCGTHRKAYLHLDDVKARLSYSPGTVDMVCGRILNHSLPDWSGGERICVAHWMRCEVHDRLEVFKAGWSWHSRFTHLMDTEFVEEQKWKRIKKDGPRKRPRYS